MSSAPTNSSANFDEEQLALVDLANYLGQAFYKFYCPTPETHAKLLTRLNAERASLPAAAGAEKDQPNLTLNGASHVDVWGLSLPAGEQYQSTSKKLLEGAHKAQLLEQHPSGILVPRVRVSSLYLPSCINYTAFSKAQRQRALARERILYAHSAWPTTGEDAIFFGPDSYRFIGFLSRALAAHAPPDGRASFRLGLDVGTGAGAGALHIAGLRRDEGAAGASQADDVAYLCHSVLGTDINTSALRFAAANAELYARALGENEQEQRAFTQRLDWRISNLYDALRPDESSRLDLVVSNPPYIAFSGERDDSTRYADGGGEHGLSLPLKIAVEAVKHLSSGGLALLYTGVPIQMDQRDPLREGLEGVQDADLVGYEILDIDVFGDDVGDPTGAYLMSGVGRLAVVGAVLRKK